MACEALTSGSVVVATVGAYLLALSSEDVYEIVLNASLAEFIVQGEVSDAFWIGG